jgi:hypothetical protein
MNKIERKDIQKGDVVREEWPYLDAIFTVEGVAHSRRTMGMWYTEKGVQLHLESGTSYLINRPKPTLPTVDGTVIIAELLAEDGPIALVLQDGKWWYLSGGSFYHPTAVNNGQWKLAKVVEA